MWSDPQCSPATPVEKSKKLLIEVVGIAAIVIAMLMVAFYGGTQLYVARQWDPLGEYPLQIVQAPERPQEVIDAVGELTSVPNNFAQTPFFFWNEEITNTGVKCVKENTDNLADSEQVEIKGNFKWISDEPPGRLVYVGEGSNVRGPGCQQYAFSNPIPATVKDEMKEMLSNGIEASVWHITGDETPIRNTNGSIEEGQGRSWRTTSFTVIHEDAP